MSSKRKKPASPVPRRVYTTRQIMDITEQRRLKEESAVQKAVLKTKVPEIGPAPVQEDLNLPPSLPVKDPPQIKEEVKEKPEEEIKEIIEGPDSNLLPDTILRRRVVRVLLLTAVLLLVFLEFPEFWENIIANKINTLIIDGSSFVLNLIQGPCTVEGAVLKLHYYKISLQGDLVALYSIELLIVFAALITFVQKPTWVRTGIIFISLFPLAIIANIVRMLWACGLALNYGPAAADRYFHGVLVGFVFIFIVSGLTFLEFLFFPE